MGDLTFSDIVLKMHVPTKDSGGTFVELDDEPFAFVQDYLYIGKKLSIRGLYYQPEQFRSLRCLKGVTYHVVVDMVADSVTYGQWGCFWLSELNNMTAYIPPGYAHGFMTMVDNSELLYKVSEHNDLDYFHILQYNDPDLHILWPLEYEQKEIVSENDMNKAKTFKQLEKILYGI